MAAINFPSSPSDGDTHTVGGVTYTYNSAETKWKTTVNSNNFLPLTGGTVSGNIALTGAIQHSGDTDTSISFGTDEIRFETNSSNRLFIGSQGQWGLGGGSYGTSGQVLTSGGASAPPSWTTLSTSNLTRSTYVAASSQTTIDFTDVPANARKVSIVFQSLSFSGSGNLLVRIGDSTGFYTSGYESNVGIQAPSTYAVQELNDGFGFYVDNPNFRLSGTMTLHNVTGNTWVYDCVGGIEDPGGSFGRMANFGGGWRTITNALTQVRITTSTGTATFDNGGVNVFYEV